MRNSLFRHHFRRMIRMLLRQNHYYPSADSESESFPFRFIKIWKGPYARIDQRKIMVGFRLIFLSLVKPNASDSSSPFLLECTYLLFVNDSAPDSYIGKTLISFMFSFHSFIHLKVKWWSFMHDSTYVLRRDGLFISGILLVTIAINLMHFLRI